ncbi:MAG: hypothetical protein ACOYNY_32320 [Caldilineaceae bacterium]
MVRGGSFDNNQNNVRSAYRNHNNIDNRNNNVGFRVVAHGFHTHLSWASGSESASATACAARMTAGAAGSWPSLPPPNLPQFGGGAACGRQGRG